MQSTTGIIDTIFQYWNIVSMLVYSTTAPDNICLHKLCNYIIKHLTRRSLKMDASLEMLKLWFRLTTMDDSRLTEKIFKWSLELANKSKLTWCFMPKKFLTQGQSNWAFFLPTLGSKYV